jgi:simple sugar transport system substrate-binding protein
MRRLLVLLALIALAVAGCGETTTLPEQDLVVRGDEAVTAKATPEETPARGRGLRIAAARIAVVSHGQASDSFWAIVKKGVFDAGRRNSVAVSYRAPETYDIARMRRLIDEAIKARLDGLVVSLPDVDGLAPAIRRAVDAGIPVVSINSGSDRFRELGILAHVGQPEYRAGVEAGARMARNGVRELLCVNQEAGNAGLDERCRGIAAAMLRAGGRSRELAVDLQDPEQSQRRIAQAVTQGDTDGILTLGPNGAGPALAAVSASGLRSRVKLATFDLSPEVLQEVRSRKLLFAVDQQPYLQGYLPIALLAERARHLVMPARGELIPTGPQFVTPGNAARVLALSRRGFR